MRPVFLSLLAMTLCGCAAGGSALEAAGLRKPAGMADALKPPRSVPIRLHAAKKLNVDAQGRPLALVARIYTLRQNAAFLRAPYDAFLDPQKEKAALGTDLLDVKDVMLVPGQRYEVVEKVSREAGFVGVVALFHSPAPQRWRLAYAVPDAEQAGVTIGAHACGLSSGAGAAAVGASAKLQSPAPCQ
ncbi:type VI secretion system lipoprotein TssJ [Massilia cavernae]|uniref:Type VI secretion system lipoprotein TssJ n=1 Tax=Massilia cavernae TaxID=2320864 RepID=A0A418XE67_9BURK|nr:type VI secretion system lipoprotein TssJ [Massilia cavernae]